MTHPVAPLVARETELAELGVLRSLAREHGTLAAAVTGPTDVGRTALVDAFVAASATAGERALQARAVAWESGRPYGALAQLLPGLEPPADPVAAAGALVASGAGVVVVDDAQWCDPETLQAISSATRHHPDAGLLVLLVRRDTAPWDPGAPDSDRVVEDLLTRTAERVVAVRPLDRDGVRRLAAAHGVTLHDVLAERLRHHTAGLPGAVVDLLRTLPRETWSDPDPVLPPTPDVRARVRRALAEASPDAGALVEALAVLGEPVDLSVAAALAGVDDPLSALDAAQHTGLLAAGRRRGLLELQLTGSMVQAAVLESLGRLPLARLHARAAGLVTDAGRRLAHEVAAAPVPDPRLGDRLAELAEERSSGGAWAGAAELLIRASRMTTDPLLHERRLVGGVDALVGAGDVPRATAYVAEVEALRETPMRNAVLGYLAIVRGRPVEAETRLARAWELVNTEREPEVAALICQRYVLHSLARCDGEALVAWADRAAALTGADSPAGLEARAIRGLGLAGSGRAAEADAWYAGLGQQVTHGAQAQRVRMAQGWLHLVLDRVDESVAELESAVPTDVLGGSSRISLWASAWLARAQFAMGEWDAALRTVRDAVDLGDRTGLRLILPLLHWTAAQVHVLRGDWPAAEESLRLGDAGPQDYPIMRAPSCLAHAQHAEARADYRGVLRALEPLTQEWARGDVAEPGLWPWPDVYANALVVEGRLDEASAFLDVHEAAAADRGHRSARARLGYARGRLLGALGRLEESRAAFEAAIALLDELPLRYDRARADFAYGQALRRAGKRREADAVIRTARELYAGLGASTYVARCDRELKAGGLAVVRGQRSFDELTPQERTVAGLVARGLSNREVGAELFISTKTVQYHLTRIYTKLGVRSRAELAGVWRPDE